MQRVSAGDVEGPRQLRALRPGRQGPAAGMGPAFEGIMHGLGIEFGCPAGLRRERLRKRQVCQINQRFLLDEQAVEFGLHGRRQDWQRSPPRCRCHNTGPRLIMTRRGTLGSCWVFIHITPRQPCPRRHGLRRHGGLRANALSLLSNTGIDRTVRVGARSVALARGDSGQESNAPDRWSRWDRHGIAGWMRLSRCLPAALDVAHWPPGQGPPWRPVSPRSAQTS